MSLHKTEHACRACQSNLNQKPESRALSEARICSGNQFLVKNISQTGKTSRIWLTFSRFDFFSNGRIQLLLFWGSEHNYISKLLDDWTSTFTRKKVSSDKASKFSQLPRVQDEDHLWYKSSAFCATSVNGKFEWRALIRIKIIFSHLSAIRNWVALEGSLLEENCKVFWKINYAFSTLTFSFWFENLSPENKTRC